jgi:hypothetical protein
MLPDIEQRNFLTVGQPLFERRRVDLGIHAVTSISGLVWPNGATKSMEHCPA